MRGLVGHRNDVRAVAFTPDGRLVSGGGDGTVRVWDPASGECLTTVRAAAPVYAVAVSPDGGTIAYAGRYAPRAESNFVHLCDPAGKPIGRLEVRTEEPGWWINPEIHRWEMTNLAVPRTVWSLAFAPNGRYIAAACRAHHSNGLAHGYGGYWWPLPHSDGNRPTVFAEDAFAVATAPVGKGFAVARFRLVAFHDQSGVRSRASYLFRAAWCPAVTFVPHRDFAAVASSRILFSVNTCQRGPPRRTRTDFHSITALAASPDGETLLVGGNPGRVEAYDADSLTRTATYDFGTGKVHAVAFAPDGLTFAVAADKGLIVCDAAI